jgi:dienelactone hydrolase
MSFDRRMAAVAISAALAVMLSLWRLHEAASGVAISHTALGPTPVTVFTPEAGGRRPAVVIAHGFAGSQQLMQSFALAIARNGYIAITFDFAGHGRHREPLTGSITEESGATRTLLRQTQVVAGLARRTGDGRLALLGHSMASDIVVRLAEEDPAAAATIAVSMFSPAVTATAPRNLLIIAGGFETMLKAEALRAVALATAPHLPEAGVTYGDFAGGTARRAAFIGKTDHVSILFSVRAQQEALAWLDRTFDVPRAMPPDLPARGPWIALLLLGAIAAGRPLAHLLPRLAKPAPRGKRLAEIWPAIVVPAIATPLILRIVPTHQLPVLVGGYLAAHFFVYGIVTTIMAKLAARIPLERSFPPGRRWLAASATLAVAAYGFLAIVWPMDSFVTSFVPAPGRVLLMAIMLAGTLAFFVADEWLTRGIAWAPLLSKLAFLLSLALAIALDFERLFFLVLIFPVIILAFGVYGLITAWTFRTTGHGAPGAIAAAIAFAWAISVTFPLVAG